MARFMDDTHGDPSQPQSAPEQTPITEGLGFRDPLTMARDAAVGEMERAVRASELPRLTGQQMELLAYLRMGFPVGKAAASVNMTKKDALVWLSEDPRARAALEYNTALKEKSIVVTRDLLISQFYEERMRSATASEGIQALTQIGKIMGFYEHEKKVAVRDATSGQKTRKQLERLTDAELAEEAGMEIDLEPTEVKYED